MSPPSPTLRFAYEWEPGDGVRSPELAATWCRLEIWVGNDCVSRVEDIESGSTRRSLYGSLYPLAEWLAYNWWLIHAHTRPTALPSHRWSFSQLRHANRREYAWLRHHNLRAAGDGFLWPDMTIVPEGSSARISWFRDENADTWPVRFISDGEHSIDSVEAAAVLADLVESVIARLHEQGVEHSALEEEWRANAGLPSEQRDFCIAAARLGLDPYSVEAEEAGDAVVRASQALEEQLLGEFLDAVDPTALDSGLDWIAASSGLVHRADGTTDERLSAVREAIVPSSIDDTQRPWTVGYSQAARVRLVLDLRPSDPFAPEEALVSIVRAEGFDHRLQALGGHSGTGSPALALNMRPLPSTTRFAAARALWHFGRQSDRDRFLLTPARTDVHKIERAFAAELLAPADGLREAFVDAPFPISDEDLDTAAAHYGVSPLVIRHQVDNQLLTE